MSLRNLDRASGVPALLETAVAAAPDGRPLLSYYDGATGEHSALSAAAVGSWVTRTTSLLRRDCGLSQGSRAAVLLPPHWQTAAVLLGSWAAGISVDLRSWATAGLPLLEPGSEGPFDVTFVARDRLRSMLEDVPAGSHQFLLDPGPVAAARADLPAGYRDYLAEVQRQPAEPQPAPVRGADPISVDGATFREWGYVAQELATTLDLRPGDRVLVDLSHHEHPLKWLLAPLSAGASLVWCANLDSAAIADIAEAERVNKLL